MPCKNENIDREYRPKTYGSVATFAQSLAIVAVSFLSVGMGMEFSISTIVIRVLYQKSKNDFPMSFTEATWYASLIYVIQPIGCFLSGTLQGGLGKKRCMIFTNVPSIAGWILLCFARSPAMLYTSNLLMGFSIGFSTSLAHPFVGEITEPRLRGTMASLLNTACFFGQALGYALETLFEWRTVALLSASCPAICTCLIFFIPESPIWLMTKGENKKAEISLRWFRGWTTSDDVKLEFLELVRYSEITGTEGKNDGKPAVAEEGLFSKFKLFNDPLVYKPFKILVVYFFVAFVVGIIPGRPFLGGIMTKAGLLEHQKLYFVILTVLQGTGSVILSCSVHHLGKRFLTLLTVSINSILLMLFGFYIMAVENRYINSTPWIPLMLLCTIYLSGSCGVTCIVWMLLGEMFPNKCRGLVTGLCAGFANVLLFALTKAYLTVETTLSLEYTFVLFGCIGFVGLVYLYFCLPETENKTLLEIEEHFSSNPKRLNKIPH